LKKILVLVTAILATAYAYCNNSCDPCETCSKQICFSKSSCVNEASFECNGNLFGKTFFSQRPQDSNSVRRILSRVNKIRFPFDDEENNKFDLTFEFQRTFNSENLGKWFFFNSSNCMTVGISDSNNPFDIDGNQLGLSLGNNQTGLIGKICAYPVI